MKRRGTTADKSGSSEHLVDCGQIGYVMTSSSRSSVPRWLSAAGSEWSWQAASVVCEAFYGGVKQRLWTHSTSYISYLICHHADTDEIRRFPHDRRHHGFWWWCKWGEWEGQRCKSTAQIPVLSTRFPRPVCGGVGVFDWSHLQTDSARQGRRATALVHWLCRVSKSRRSSVSLSAPGWDGFSAMHLTRLISCLSHSSWG